MEETMEKEVRDLHGTRLAIGMKAKLSGGYADRAVPVYLSHEEVEVIEFHRTRVTVKVLSKMYEGHPKQFLAVLPKTLVAEGSVQR